MGEKREEKSNAPKSKSKPKPKPPTHPTPIIIPIYPTGGIPNALRAGILAGKVVADDVDVDTMLRVVSSSSGSSSSGAASSVAGAASSVAGGSSGRGFSIEEVPKANAEMLASADVGSLTSSLHDFDEQCARSEQLQEEGARTAAVLCRQHASNGARSSSSGSDEQKLDDERDVEEEKPAARASNCVIS